uniref:Uncharacterized protein n=1 Tax=Sphaerodactylus townsendi TaxID=933632 RepID=A0ACB8FVB1_9SAUR
MIFSKSHYFHLPHLKINNAIEHFHLSSSKILPRLFPSGILLEDHGDSIHQCIFHSGASGRYNCLQQQHQQPYFTLQPSPTQKAGTISRRMQCPRKRQCHNKQKNSMSQEPAPCG